MDSKYPTLSEQLTLPSVPTKRDKDLARFWSRVNKTETCWEWMGTLLSTGFGRFGCKKKSYQAHRFAFLIAKSDPGELCVLHRCGNRRCVNPAHLFLSTHGDHTDPRTDEERFWAKVNKTEHCWEWIGTLHHSGYGVTKLNRKTIIAHRLSWTLHFGPIPGGLFVCHHCDNPKCVRPDHLFVGTPGDNNADRHSKGRSTRGDQDGNARLTEQSVVATRERYAEGGVSQRELAVKYGVSPSTISSVVSRSSWKHV